MFFLIYILLFIDKKKKSVKKEYRKVNLALFWIDQYGSLSYLDDL